MHRLLRLLGVMIVGLGILAMAAATPPGAAQVPPAPTTAPGTLINSDQYIRSDRLGITFINSAENHADPERYRNALLLGAGWTRWPLYWDRVEPRAGRYDWAAYDRLVSQDMQHGLRINAILLGVPQHAREEDRIAGLNAPIFADGSDVPGADKTLNPENRWAVFVEQAVQRYRPGGTLAQQNGWRGEQGVRVWEIWNEPDHAPFWSGSIRDYARLLKVAYIVIHRVDPQATVMFGGLLYGTPDNWLARVLAIYEGDPLVEQNNWYMDAVAVHSYGYPWRSGWLALYVRQTLIAYELEKPIWLNESGVPVWDDYPGPVWASEPEGRLKRATAEQQAWFFIQSSAHAWAEGVDKVFFHQLYDDCGDQPAGTDFPPHNGELCTDGALCYGDGFGLFRNERDSVCFSQHPFPGTPRPAARAYRLVADIFGRVPFTGGDVVREDGITRITFERPTTGELIHVVWNRQFEPVTASLAAAGSGATLYTLRDTRALLPDADGNYTLRLPAAQPDGYPTLEPGDRSAIGGEPLILVEAVAGDPSDPAPSFTLEAPPASGTAIAPPADAIIAPRQPTTAPEDDTTPPQTYVEALPLVSQSPFTVRWGATDDGGIEQYLVWVKIDDGEWQPWLETTRTRAEYTGEPGRMYHFAVWAVDQAGNWSPNTDLEPQAVTRVE